MLTLPNFLTLLRIIAVPAFLLLVSDGAFAAALVLFLGACITDAVDGVLARLMDSKSTLGATLDPLADKLLLVSSFVLLTWIGALPRWLFILVLSRDAVILLGYLAIYVFSEPIEVAPSFIGKFNSFNEMFTVGFALVTLARPDLPTGTPNLVMWYLTGLTAAVSGVHYIYRGLLWFQRHGSPTSQGTAA